MPHMKSQAKRLRQDEARRLRNRSVKSKVRTMIKKTLALVEDGKIEDAQAACRETTSTLDKAAKRRIIHPNAAARQKSRMHKHLKKAQGKGQPTE